MTVKYFGEKFVSNHVSRFEVSGCFRKSSADARVLERRFAAVPLRRCAAVPLLRRFCAAAPLPWTTMGAPPQTWRKAK